MLRNLLKIALCFPIITIQAAEINDVSPECPLPNFKEMNQIVNFSKTHHKALYLGFWASWCGPCQASFPFLQNLHQELSTQGLEVVAVNVDETRDDALAFLNKHPADFTVLADPEGSCPQKFQLKVMPTSFLINAEGKIVGMWQGFHEDEKQSILQHIKKVMTP